MKITILIIFVYFTTAFSQWIDNVVESSINDSCPKLFTGNIILFSDVSLEKILIDDSSNYSSPPIPINNIDSLCKTIKYSDFALYAEQEGRLVIQCSIDSSGFVTSTKLIKGIYNDLDERADSISKLFKFKPAIMEKKNISSTLEIFFRFKIKRVKDSPEEIVKSIRYDDYYLSDGFTFIVYPNDSVYYKEREKAKEITKFGKTDNNTFKHLSTFILSQCFLKWTDYFNGIIHSTNHTLTLELLDRTHSVDIKGNFYPIGFWAIQKIILDIIKDTDWEEL